MKTISIFVHFDKDNKIHCYVIKYLQELKNQFNEIIFVSNSNLNSKEQDKIKGIVRHIIIRDNKGYDFMAWRDGIRYIGYNNLHNYDELVIANDSNYAPLFPFKNIFQSIKNIDCDFWGITESSSFKTHLQSSFLVFKKNIIISNVFKNFWENIKVENSKTDVIKKYELGLQEQLEAAGFKSHVIFKIKLSKYKVLKYKIKRILVLIKRRFRKDLGYYNKKTYFIKNKPKELLLNFFDLSNINITICCWEELIKMGCPFLKVEVLRDNSYGLKNVKNWENIIQKYSEYDINLIKSHLKQLDL